MRKNRFLWSYKYLAILLIIQISFVLYLATIYQNLPPEIPLFYGALEGKDQLGKNTFIFIPVVSSLCASVLLIILSKTSKDKFVEKMLVGASYIVTILAIFTTIKIIRLVS